MLTPLEEWKIIVRNFMYTHGHVTGDYVTLNFDDAGMKLGELVHEKVEAKLTQAHDEAYDQGLVDGRAEGFDDGYDRAIETVARQGL